MRLLSVENLFGTSGVRGIFGESLNVDFIFRLGYVLGKYLGEKTILVGWDCRKSSLAISGILTSALLSAGSNVDHAGLITTPGLQKYVGDHREYSGGVMITASHNPPEYNGIKVILSDGIEISEREELEITRLYKELDIRLDWKEIASTVRDIHDYAITHYVDSVSKHIDKETLKKRWILGVDYANCSAIKSTRRLINLFYNAKVIEVNHYIDGLFPGRLPEPTPEHLTATIEAFKQNNVDVGVAFDGDGDRGVIIDGKGRFYWGDEIGTMIAYYLGDKLGINEVVTPVSSSILVERTLETIGIRVIRTKVGAKNIITKMRERKCKLGFEENGGIIYAPHLLGRDGAITFIMTLNLINEKKKELHKLRDKLPKYFQKKTKIRVEGLKRDEIYKILLEIEEEKLKETIDIDHTDGIKLFFDENTWVLIRPSGTEPLIRIFVEAKELETVNKLVKEYQDIVYRKSRKLLDKK